MEFISRYRNHIITMEPAAKDKKGKRAEFQNGRYVTVDKKEIEFLRKHPDFGLSFTDVPEPKLKEA